MIRDKIRAQPDAAARFKKWFINEVFWKRAAQGIVGAASIFSLCFVINSILLSALNFSFVHPIVGLSAVIWTVLSWRLYLFSLLSTLVFAILASLTSARLVRVKTCEVAVRAPRMLLWIGGFFVVDLLQKHLFAFYSMEVSGARFASTLNRDTVVGRRLVFFALIVSAVQNYAKMCLKAGMPIEFSDSYHGLLPSIRENWRDTCKKSFKGALISFQIALVTFMMFGDKLMSHFIRFDSEGGVGLLRILWCFLDLRLLSSTFALLFLQDFAIRNLHFMLNLFMTKPLEFEVPALELLNPMEEQRMPNLPSALELRDPPLLWYLAYNDLKCLARESRERRRRIFSLSVPGAHPWNWIAIWESCSKTLGIYLEELKQRNLKLAIKWDSIIDSNVWQAPADTKDRSFLLQPRHCRLRSSANGVNGPSVVESETPMKPTSLFKKKPFARLREFSLLDFLKKKLHWKSDVDWWPSDPEIVAWTVDSLASLVCFSYTEDEYGIVQQDLSGVIALLIDVYVESDRNCRLSGSGRYNAAQKQSRINHIRQKTRTALCAVREKFAPHIATDIKLSEEHIAYLNSINDTDVRFE